MSQVRCEPGHHRAGGYCGCGLSDGRARRKTVLYIVLGIFLGLLHFMHFGLLAFLLYPLLGLALFAFWIFVMYKAYQHEKFKLPIIGDLVEGMVK